MKELIGLFDFSILRGNKVVLHKNSLGERFVPQSATVEPTFKTVLPNGVTHWVGEQGTEFKSWCKKLNVGATFTRFDKGKGKLTLEKLEVY